MNEAEEQYGDERLFDLIEKESALDSKQLATEILSDVKKFTGDLPQADDITLLIIKRSK